jgi:hypothetical protein
MANTKSSKKNVKRNKPSRKQNAENDKKIPDAKNKMRGESKQATLITLLERPCDATIDKMAKATGWQRHSIRGMMSGVLKKRIGLSIASEKEERGRVYRIAA